VFPSRENDTSCAASTTATGMWRTSVAVSTSTTSSPLKDVLTVRKRPLGWIVVVWAPADERLER
jgi:hypothetical protein